MIESTLTTFTHSAYAVCSNILPSPLLAECSMDQYVACCEECDGDALAVTWMT